MRLENELSVCKKSLKHTIIIKESKIKTFPIVLEIQLVDSPGPYMEQGVVRTRDTHKLNIIISKEYPYQKPIVRWKTPIFHPNIMTAEDGGYVCTKLLNNWRFNSNLFSFIKGIESLLANPNPDNPYESKSCTEAAEYFNKNTYISPKINKYTKKPVIISDDKEDIYEN